MFKGFFSRSKENHARKSKKTITTSSDNQVASTQCYLVLCQPFGKNFDVHVVFSGENDHALQDRQQFERVCRLSTTEDGAMLAGKHLGAPNQYGIFKVAYPVSEVPELISKGLLSKIIMGGWASPYFNDEDYIKNHNFEPKATDNIISISHSITDSSSWS